MDEKQLIVLALGLTLLWFIDNVEDLFLLRGQGDECGRLHRGHLERHQLDHHGIVESLNSQIKMEIKREFWFKSVKYVKTVIHIIVDKINMRYPLTVKENLIL